MLSGNFSKNFLPILASTLLCGILTSCGSDDNNSSFVQPSAEPVVIEETDGGCDLLAQEFGVECDDEAKSVKRVPYKGISTYSSRASDAQQKSVAAQFPHLYSSIDKQFPLRGSWRKTKEEVMDLVDRHIWSPEEQRPVELMKYFDMALVINVAPRTNLTPEDHSAQRMQVYVRKDDSNKLEDWERIHTWPISSGLPGGKKIATFTGVYKFDKDERRFSPDYYSNEFNNVRMYETMFLYHQYQYHTKHQKAGVAIHGTYVKNKLGRRDSGGCIRLARENAQCLFYTLKGDRTERCLNGGKLKYWGRVPSLLPRNGEADPEYLSSGLLEVGGYRVLIAIFSDEKDKL